MKEIRDHMIAQMADEIVTKIKNCKLFGESVDENNTNALIVAAYLMGQQQIRDNQIKMMY